MSTVLREMSDKRLGMTCVLAADGRLVGVITDGDLRRRLVSEDRLLERTAGDVMSTNPNTIAPSAAGRAGAADHGDAADHVAHRRRRRRPGAGRGASPRSVADRAVLMNESLTLLAVLVALLLGLAAGQGMGALQAARRPLDRPPQGPRVPSLHPWAQLSGLEPARPGDRRADHRRRNRRRRARDPPDPRQPLSREGTGDARDPDASAAVAVSQADQARTGLRAAVSRSRLQTRRVRGPRAGGVHRGAAIRRRQPVCPAEPREAARGAAAVARGLRHPAAAGGHWPTPRRNRNTRPFWRSSRPSWGCRPWPEPRRRPRSRGSNRRSSSTPARCRPISTSATCSGVRDGSTRRSRLGSR